MTKGVKEKASLISQNEISFVYKLFFFKSFCIAKDGAILKSNGSHSASANPIISAKGFKLFYSNDFSLIINKEQAPSFNLDALAPVIVPCFF